MANNKLLLAKIILILIILFSFSTVFGVITYLNSTKNSPQIIIHPSPNSDIDISDWKTYRNEKYGYEIKYPNDWDINSADLSSIQYLDSKYKDFYESPFTNPLSIDTIEENNKNIEGWISGKAEDRVGFPYQKLEEITVAETKTFLLSDPITIGNDIETVFILKNNNAYKISAPIGESDKQFKKILSTFEFTKK